MLWLVGSLTGLTKERSWWQTSMVTIIQSNFPTFKVSHEWMVFQATILHCKAILCQGQPWLMRWFFWYESCPRCRVSHSLTEKSSIQSKLVQQLIYAIGFKTGESLYELSKMIDCNDQSISQPSMCTYFIQKGWKKIEPPPSPSTINKGN